MELDFFRTINPCLAFINILVIVIIMRGRQPIFKTLIIFVWLVGASSAYSGYFVTSAVCSIIALATTFVAFHVKASGCPSNHRPG